MADDMIDPQAPQQDTHIPEPRAIIRAGGARRAIGMTVVWGLGCVLVLLGVSRGASSVGHQIMMLGFGALALWSGARMRRATEREIHLTQEDLRDSSGIVIARLDEIKSVDRGVFAFKPSNGFVLRLAKADTRQWHPGLWWRLGNRVGVGGVTPAAQTKVVAELIAETLHAKTNANV